jgi:hypothetical protein
MKNTKRHTVPDRTAWLIPATIRVVAEEIFLTACSQFILNYPHATIRIHLPGCCLRSVFSDSHATIRILLPALLKVSFL